MFASGGEDKSIRLWDTASGRAVHTLPGHIARVAGVTFSPDGKRLASVSDLEGALKLWDVVSGKEALTIRVVEPGGVVFSPDGWQIATGSGDATVRIWDAKARPTPD